MEESHNDNVVAVIEQDLKDYDKIFLFDTADQKVSACMSYFCHSRQMQETDKKVLVLGAAEVSGAAEGCCRSVTKQQFEAMLDIYDMYEFSDKFQFVGAKEQYGSMFNYVETGLLTYSEMFEAMLH